VHWLRNLHSALHAYMVQSTRRSFISETLRDLQTHLMAAILVWQFECFLYFVFVKQSAVGRELFCGPVKSTTFVNRDLEKFADTFDVLKSFVGFFLHC